MLAAYSSEVSAQITRQGMLQFIEIHDEFSYSIIGANKSLDFTKYSKDDNNSVRANCLHLSTLILRDARKFNISDQDIDEIAQSFVRKARLFKNHAEEDVSKYGCTSSHM